MMFINNVSYRGDIEDSAIITAICAGFHDTPQTCKNIEIEN